MPKSKLELKDRKRKWRSRQDYALQNGLVILTADTDFVTLANAPGPWPKVTLLEDWDYPTTIAAQTIRTNKVRIAGCEKNREPLLILRKT